MIETPRLILRPFTHDDLDAFASMNAEAEVMRYIGDGKQQSRAQSEMRMNGDPEDRAQICERRAVL
jgi:RimJ/RimL family protein N-acetyltransferase